LATARSFTQNLTQYTKHRNPHTFNPSIQIYHEVESFFLLSAAALVNAATATATESAVELQNAGSYTILAKSGISTLPKSSITGDIAVSTINAGAITGFELKVDSEGVFSTASQFTGKAYATNYAAPSPTKLTSAVSDATRRPNDDANRANIGEGAIGGLTLTPGVYTFGEDISFS
jgi:hypothetical protein